MDGASRAWSRYAELALLVAFAVVSCWVLALNLWMVSRHGGVWSGTDGWAAQDPMQYLAWVRDVSEHGLASNLYVLDATPHDYIQPMVAVSGALSAIGVAPWAAVLLWKPLAIGACFIAVRAFVWATVEERRYRIAVLLVALFFAGWGILTLHLFDWHGNDIFWSVVTNEMWIPYSMWGYTFTAVAFACMVGALVAYARDREVAGLGWLAPALGALASWLHPWQGQTLLVILVASEAVLWSRRTRPRWDVFLVTAGATAVPLAYYVVLGRADVSWRQASSAGHQTWPLWIVLLSLLPLAVPALLAYRERPRTFLGAAVRAWPPAAIFVLLVDELAHADGEIHALLGIGLPLAVLAIAGVRSVSALRPTAAVAVAAALVITVPPAYEQLRIARNTVRAVYYSNDANFITGDEDDALEWLDQTPGGGGVLTNPYLGTLVPARTGRRTYVGNLFWSRDFFARAVAVLDLFLGQQPPAAARRFVRDSGARFILSDCRSPTDLTPALGALLVAKHRFGCANVYEVRTSGGR